MTVLTADFTKACGLGNDFVILSLEGLQSLNLADLSVFLADRRYGIGCDQVIYYQTKDEADYFNIRFFNADGSEAEACGNGSRCVAMFLMQQNGINKVNMHTLGGLLECEEGFDGTIVIKMPKPIWDDAIDLKEYQGLSSPSAVFVNMGNPHLVCFVEDSNYAETLGSMLESHLSKIDSNFPEHVNVGFVQVLDEKSLLLRVWERGAGLTPACGTGACAAMVAAKIRGLVQEEITVRQPGGELSIRWEGDDLYLQGEAYITYTGQIPLSLDLFSENEPSYVPFSLDSLYVGTITLAQPDLSGEEEAYEIWADFGSLGQRRTSAVLGESYEIWELVGKKIIGVLEEDGDAFTLLAEINENEEMNLISPEESLVNGERVQGL